MNKQNFSDIERVEEKKASRRLKKKKTAMKVSGANVKKLQKIIIAK